MEHAVDPRPITDLAQPPRLDAATAISTLRTLVGLASWASPGASWRTFGLGRLDGDPRSELITRLFGVRDLALGLAVKHPRPEVQRAALQVGVAVDAFDVAASLIAMGRGAPKASGLGVGGGAALFVALGIAALRSRADRRGDPTSTAQ